MTRWITRAAGRSVLRTAGLVCLVLVSTAAFGAGSAPAARPKVLRVGRFEGKKGKYNTIQAAVDAAKAGDWILIGPGDYKEAETRDDPGGEGGDGAGRRCSSPSRACTSAGWTAMAVMIDGTKPGSPRVPAGPKRPDFGSADAEGTCPGNNGVVVYKARGVSAAELLHLQLPTAPTPAATRSGSTAATAAANRTSAAVRGAYLQLHLDVTGAGPKRRPPSTASSPPTANGPGIVRARLRQQHGRLGATTSARARTATQRWTTRTAENSDLGYSGTNSGGHLVVENSEFEGNEAGSSPTARTTTTRRRRRTAPVLPVKPVRLARAPAGCSSRTTSTTTTTRMCRQPAARKPRRSGPGS